MKNFPTELDQETIADIRNGDHADFDEIETRETGTWRHGTEHQTIVRHVPSGKMYAIDWRSTPDGPADGEEDSQPYEVREATRIDYEAIE